MLLKSLNVPAPPGAIGMVVEAPVEKPTVGLGGLNAV